MAITKRILGEKILRRINGGDVDPTRDVDPRDVYLEAETCLSYLIEKYLNMYGEDIQGEFISVFEAVPLIKNTVRNRFYAILPAQLISVRSTRNISGLRQVSGSQDEYDVFIPMKTGDAAIFYGLEASSIGFKIGYWLEGDKIIFENMSPEFEGKTVMVKMISSIYSTPEDDFIAIPASMELELEDLIFQRMMGMENTDTEDKQDEN